MYSSSASQKNSLPLSEQNQEIQDCVSSLPLTSLPSLSVSSSSLSPAPGAGYATPPPPPPAGLRSAAAPFASDMCPPPGEARGARPLPPARAHAREAHARRSAPLRELHRRQRRRRGALQSWWAGSFDS